MNNTIRKDLLEECELTNMLAQAMAIKAGFGKKKISNLAVFESEFGKFPDNLHDFRERLMRLHGYEPGDFYENIEIREEIIDMKNNNRVFIVMIAF